MPSAPAPSLTEREFLLSALQQSIRLDNRPLDALRPPSISFGDDPGVADVRLGDTRVVCTVSAKLARPYEERKFDGVFTIQTELSQMVGGYVEVGRPSALENTLSTHLDTTFRRSGALSTESLCLLAGRVVWHLNASIHILHHDGSLATAASIALICALESMRVNDTEVKGGEVRVFAEDERDKVKLGGGGGMMFWPISVEFAYFPSHSAAAVLVVDEMDHDGPSTTTTTNTNTITILDPTLPESQLSTSTLLVAATESGEVIQLTKPGGDTVDAVTVLGCVEKSIEAVKALHANVKAALEKERERKGEGKRVQRALRSENER